MKKSELKTLIKAIISEVKKQRNESLLPETPTVQDEHRGAKGMNVGKTRSKNFPSGKSGKIQKSNPEDSVKKFLMSSHSADHLLDLSDVLGLQIPMSISKFDPAEVAKFIMDNLYPEDPITKSFTKNEELIDKAYTYLVAAGLVK